MPALYHQQLANLGLTSKHTNPKRHPQPTASLSLPSRRLTAKSLSVRSGAHSNSEETLRLRSYSGSYCSDNITHSQSMEAQIWHEINKKEINKTICNWFSIWHPRQQRIILHGITDRCSTSQLETLATTLEPVFHRDFITFHRKRYPVIPSPVSLLPTVKHNVRRRSRQLSATSSSPLTLPHLPNKKPRDNKKLKDTSTTSLLSIEETSEQKTETGMKPVPENKVIPDTNQEHVHEKLDVYAKELVETAIEEAFEQIYRREVTSENELAEYLSGIIMHNAIKDVKSLKELPKDEDSTLKNIVNISDALGNLIMTKSSSEIVEDKDVSITVANEGQPQTAIVEHVSVQTADESKKSSAGHKLGLYSSHSRTPTSVPGSHIRSRRSSRASLKVSPSFASLYPEVTRPLSETVSLKDIIHRELSDMKQSENRQTIQSVDLVLADRSIDRRFRTQHHNSFSKHTHDSHTMLRESPVCSPKLSPHKAKSLKLCMDGVGMRTGLVKKPSYIQDLQVSPRHTGNKLTASLPPGQAHAGDGFSKQTEKIWEWISGWQDYERLTLLSEVIKLCNSDLIKFIARCLFDRLKESLIINWLPDHLLLLIFSNLSWEDIDSCAKVCKRWKYISSMDEIWMIKCLEFGQHENIPDVIERMTAASHDNQSIDWRMAYFEIQRITRDAKSALAKPNPILISPEAPSIDEEMASISKAEVPLRRGTAAQLARESQRLKQGLSSTVEEDIWWSQREARSGSDSYRTNQVVTPSPHSTIASLPTIYTRYNKKHERTSNSVSGYGSVCDGESSVFSVLQGGQESSPQTNNIQHAMSMDKMTSISSQAGYEKLETKAVMQWIRGRSKPGAGDGEIALDVRPDLLQAEDIMGACQPSYILQWKDEDSKSTTKKFAGSVPSVQKVRKFSGHMDSVLCIGLSKRRLISGSMDRSIRVWDIKSGRSIHKMYGHKGAVTCLKFVNNVLYSGSWDMNVMVWDLVSFKRKSVLNGHKGSISCLELNKEYLFSASHDGTVRVWSRVSHMLYKVLEIHTSHVMGLYVEGSNIITGSSDKSIRITNYLTGESRMLVANHPEPVHRMMIHGQLMITSSLTGRVYFWNKKTGDAEAGVQAHSTQHPIHALAVYNGRLFTASGDQTVKEWDIFTMTCVRCLQGHKSPVNDFKLTDKRMVSCSTDGQIRIWDMDRDNTSAEITDDTIPYEIINQRDLQ